MKIMILSDSHAMSKKDLMNLLQAQKVDAYIHCGDIYMTYTGLPLPNFHLVRGNNDFGDIPQELELTLDKKRFFVTHGHHYYVDYGVEELLEIAKEKDVDIVCFGHTHRPYLQQIDNITFINPGSCQFPRGNYRHPTYVIYDTTTDIVAFYDVSTNEPCDPFTETKENKKSWFYF